MRKFISVQISLFEQQNFHCSKNENLRIFFTRIMFFFSWPCHYFQTCWCREISPSKRRAPFKELCWKLQSQSLGLCRSTWFYTASRSSLWSNWFLFNIYSTDEIYCMRTDCGQKLNQMLQIWMSSKRCVRTVNNISVSICISFIDDCFNNLL